MQREHFSSRLGFVLAAAGAAVGLGNIWGFPTQAASNGGGAFLFIYLLLILIVAYPMLLVEMAIGRHGQANPIDSMRAVGKTPLTKMLGEGVGWIGLAVPCLVLAFYSVVAGWLVASMLGAAAHLAGLTSAAEWLKGFSVGRNIFGVVLFYLLTILIVKGGVKQGIEKWSKRLMPALLALFVMMFVYIMTQQGAVEGLKHYLVPDFSRIWDKDLILAAMGQGFFSLTIGGCSMLIYGSYLSKSESLPKTAMSVTLVDTGVAFLAGLVVLPAMFVAMQNGVEIYDANNQLIDSDTLVFSVLPLLFDKLGYVGDIVALVFFVLMTVAALTSSISMLECPVALVSERSGVSRGKTSWLLGGVIGLFSIVLVFNFPGMFGMVATIATQYFQPFAALLFCLFGGWVWSRNGKMNEILQGDPDFAQSLYGRIWPWYVKFVCPVLVFTVLWVTI
ncbi:sodium-dependent transporter [Thaumasiovibrio subtropicus]|uniref:sodium-dependent transporter n=1 Tax=Thaumasiovibrio subtropicus TaxID=1891207 RepID=UPI000B354EA3|nr:sodium-dependent transporter [Thaumasiovibrio subtropicus]